MVQEVGSKGENEETVSYQGQLLKNSAVGTFSSAWTVNPGEGRTGLSIMVLKSKKRSWIGF